MNKNVAATPSSPGSLQMTWQPYRLRFARPIRTARGLFLERQGFLVCMQDANGAYGLGDAAPWPGFGSSLEACAAGLQQLAQRWHRVAWPTHTAWMQTLVDFPPEVAYAASLAWWDHQGRQHNRPIAHMLCADAHTSVPTHALVDSALEAQQAIAQGATHLKVKMGRQSLADDVTRIGALRAAVGPDVGLRLDVNGAWPVDVAIRATRLLSAFSPEWLEQPTAAEDIDALAQVRRAGTVPIAADESLISMASCERIVAQAAADILVIKPMFLGSLETAIAVGHYAQAHGLQTMVTHAFESAIGRSGAWHVAAALKTSTACGLLAPAQSDLGTFGEVDHFSISNPATAGAGYTLLPTTTLPQAQVCQ